MSELPWPQVSGALATITDPATIRSRTKRVLDAALAGETAFAVDLSKLGPCVDFVMQVTNENYPRGDIPFHGRYEHLKAGGVDRLAKLLATMGPADRVEQARALVDLVVVSVLLDAGAGPAWTYVEDGVTYSRSEGLAVASAAMFMEGAFSHDGSRRVTAEGLASLTVDRVSRGMQVSAQNPMTGLEGRATLLKRLETSLRSAPALFPGGRPGGMVDALLAQPQPVAATSLLRLLLFGFSTMWPARVTLEGIGFGDVWPWRGDGPDAWIPFHKLSQWLAYSLVEPLEHGGVRFTGVEELTGLPEYRNGGLFLDFGVLTLRDPSLATTELEASHPAIIEWRALTVQLLDRVGDEVCRRMGKTKQQLPLARVLQGGTWSAGRAIAKQKRPGGLPPLTLKSDGMVF
ncbi:MAG: URC4/urg3 family protein [Myxococcaceae bacterium]|jgi:hypothetical protein|nr:URC4/urg3 family protein [Myxococcaceae bacterium]